MGDVKDCIVEVRNERARAERELAAIEERRSLAQARERGKTIGLPEVLDGFKKLHPEVFQPRATSEGLELPAMKVPAPMSAAELEARKRALDEQARKLSTEGK